ncbi:MAG: aminotransferase class I/II-fold pyridoxal phosphate-dependent enzyme, partial [Alphaproteobacteria bacterium]|nr:aminotransferase class I/II-fold pyridoxal phosphate-dependent enzyme [Alphaproteobacteria bacterium]
AATAGRAAMLDRAFVEKSLTHNLTWMPRIQESIRQAGFEPLPSRANFFLIRFASDDQALAAHAFMQQRGILLRQMAPYGLPSFLRMSLGDDEEMEITSAAFKDFAQSQAASS